MIKEINSKINMYILNEDLDKIHITKISSTIYFSIANIFPNAGKKGYAILNFDYSDSLELIPNNIMRTRYKYYEKLLIENNEIDL